MREAGCASQLGSCGSSGEIAGVLGIVHIVLAAMVAVICVARDNCMTGGLPSDFPQYRHVSKSLRFRYRGGREFSTSDCPHCRIVEGAQHFSDDVALHDAGRSTEHACIPHMFALRRQALYKSLKGRSQLHTTTHRKTLKHGSTNVVSH